MKKLKSNKNRLIIIMLVILFIISITTVITIKSDIFKNNAETTEKNQENNETNNNLESDKIEEEKKEESVNPSEEKNEDNKVDKEESNNTKPNNKEEKPSNNTSNTKPNTNNNISDNNKPNNKPENKPSDDNNNNENTSNKSETEENTEEKPVTPPVMEDKNDIKRKNMESTYGIKILYGNEIGNYHPRGITPTRLTIESDIETYLTRLNGELAKYPKGFFNDFNKRGMPLSIYLVKGVNGAFAGFTDYEFMNDIKLTLVTDYNLEYTIHHELMHYIDCYLDIVMYPYNPYSEYEALNPSGYVYGNAKEEYIYNIASRPRGTYFISSYGATHVKEDRAEVFKYMTARAYAPIGCFEPNEIIRKKAEIISKQIKTYFPSVTGTAIWDRFIK